MKISQWASKFPHLLWNCEQNIPVLISIFVNSEHIYHLLGNQASAREFYSPFFDKMKRIAECKTAAVFSAA